ncbi:PAS domain S-box protein [Desulfococcaceae bacterium HSG7]|nr:PAS domain S-box protein [Desulfococcaceae bacterium HSG7]
MQNDTNNQNTELRKQAEKVLQDRQADFPETSELSPDETQRLLHELRTHQIELEMQNEELRLSQSELNASRDKYQDLYDFAPTGYFTLNDQNIILEVNLTGAGMLGVGRSELIGTPFYCFIIRDNADDFYFHRQKLIETKARQTFELKLKNQSGAEFYALLESEITRENEGDSHQIRIAVSNIDERKRAELAIEESDSLTRSILDGLMTNIAVLDDRGEIILVNKHWRKFAEQNGVSAEAVSEGTNYLDVCSKASGDWAEGSKAFAHDIRKVLSGEKICCESEYPCHAPDEERWFVGRVTLCAGQCPRCVIVAHENITERKQAEAEALAYAERFKMFFSSVSDAIFVHPFKEDGFAPFIEVNDIACERYGYSREEFLQLSAPDITKKPDAATHSKPDYRSKLFENSRLVFETVHIKRSGETFPVEINSNIVYQFDKPVILAVVRDITGRKQAEEKLQKSERKYKNLVENSLMAVVQATVDGEIVFANQKAAEFWGYKDAQEFVNEYDPSKAYLGQHQRPDMIDKIRQNGFVVNREQEFRRKNGGSIWLLLSAFLDRETDIITTMAVEITELKQIEKKLQKSKRKYKNLIENTLLMVLQATVNDEIIYANQRTAEYLGYNDVQEFSNEFIPSKAYLGKHQRSDMIAALKQDGFIMNREQELLTKSGGSVWGLYSVSLDRQTGIITSVGVDITNWKKAEKEKEQLLNIIENAPYFIGWADADRKIQYVNPAGRKMVGVTGNDYFIGKSIGFFQTKKGYAAIQNIGVPHAIKDGFWDGETELLGHDGRIIPVQQTIIAHYDEEGDFEFTSTIMRDISDLKKSLELTNEIIEHSPVGIAVYEGSGPCSDVNDAITDMIGAAKSDILSSNWLQIKSWQEAGMTDIAKRALAQNSKKRFEYHGNTSYGKFAIADCHFTPISNSRLLVTAVDITDIKKNEQKLQRIAAELSEHKQNLEKIIAQRMNDLRIANAKLQRADRLKDEFLANMSHELRTPLTAVLGMSEALIDQVYGPLNEKQIKSLQTVENSGDHLLNLINDILDLSKINAGKMELQIGRVSVEAVCQASLKMIKQIAIKKKQTLSVNVDSRLTYIRADMLRLKQILVNLLMNAVKFTSDNGKIGLEADYAPHLNMVEFAVRDTGIGISEENMKKLFKPFVQIDGSFTRQHEGTGLGLVMVSKLAEMHGGSVAVESEEGKFSIFTVRLPHHPDEDPVNGKDLRGVEHQKGIAPQLPESLIEHKHRARILMADDNMENIETVADYLKAKGYDVSLAYNGFQAVQMTFEEKPDLILMDIQMPVMDGLKAIKEIRSREIELRSQAPKSESKRIPIIALTALAMPGDKEKCLEIGADEYISKPAGLKMLAGMIEELIGSS